jgi:hypothetical protein
MPLKYCYYFVGLTITDTAAAAHCYYLQLERCRTTVFYTGKGSSADTDFRLLAKVLGYEHKLDASRKGCSGFSSHHRAAGRSRLHSGDKLEKQQQQQYAPDESAAAVLSDDDDEQARRLIAQESQTLAVPVNFQVRRL